MFRSQRENKALNNQRTREDIDACIYGFMHLAKVARDINVPISPGYINSDLIKNWFAQMRSL